MSGLLNQTRVSDVKPEPCVYVTDRGRPDNPSAVATEPERQGTFERLFESHYWAVRAYVLRRAPGAVVDDVVSETFLVAWRRPEAVAADALPWLLAVARRVLANHLRGERRRGALATRLQSLALPEPGWEPPAEMSERLADAIRSLSAREREALLLVAWDGLDPSRAAVVAGCTAATFRARLHRARKRVVEVFESQKNNPTAPPIAEEAR
jgi:RNA polymerase sigma-70 factor (ECF subfamily)